MVIIYTESRNQTDCRGTLDIPLYNEGNEKMAQQIVTTTSQSYDKEVAGLGPLTMQLNRLFLRPRVSSTVAFKWAKMYGTLLKELGLLSQGYVVLKTLAELVGNTPMRTITNMELLVGACHGNVLFLEAGNWSVASEGILLDSLASELCKGVNRDIAVVLVGSEERMKTMLAQHAHLNREFSRGEAFELPGFLAATKEDKNTSQAVDSNVLENMTLQAMCGRVQGSSRVGKFHKCFEPFVYDDSPAGEALRVKGWENLTDEEEKGATNVTTLHEIDEWIRRTVVDTYGESDGVTLWKHFRPCSVKAFAQTKQILLLPQSIESKEFVERRAFRLLCVRLCIYVHMNDAFSVLNDEGDPSSMLEVTKEEFTNNYARVAKHGFVGTSSLEVENTTSIWDVYLDTAGRGFVRFDGFCNFLRGMFGHTLAYRLYSKCEDAVWSVIGKESQFTKHRVPCRILT